MQHLFRVIRKTETCIYHYFWCHTIETTKFIPAMLMFGRELNVPLDLLLGWPQAETPSWGLRASIATAHDFAPNHHQAGRQWMKRRDDIRSDAFTFRMAELLWLYNAQHKNGNCPKLTRPWEGPCVVVQRLNTRELTNRRLLSRRRRRHSGKPHYACAKGCCARLSVVSWPATTANRVFWSRLDSFAT